MSVNLKKYLSVLQFISSIKDKKLREGILKQYASKDDFFNALHEIAVNTVNKKLTISPSIKRKLKPHKKIIINLSKSNKSKRSRKKQVVQSGGFLPYLIPIVLSLLK